MHSAFMLTPLQQLAAGLSGIAGGLLSGFFGVGGNVILIPLLALTLGLTQHQAQGLTLAALLPPLNLPAVWQYRRAGVPLSWRVVGWTALGFVASVALGSALANVVPAAALRVVFATLLLLTAARMWRPKPGDDGARSAELPPRVAFVALIAGAAAGFASGLLGIGGAIVLIPLLRRFLKLGQKEAQLTSLAVLLPPIALPGVVVYARAQEHLPWGALLSVAGGFLLGSLLGARLNRLISPARLQRGFAVLLVISAGALIFTALRG